MAILVLVFLFAGVAIAIAYPLLSPQTSAATGPTITDRDVEKAVRRLRAAPRGGLQCPNCGHAYQRGDSFCVKCGAGLPVDIVAATPSAEPGVCPACGVPLRPDDVFCSKCGHRVAAGEGS